MAVCGMASVTQCAVNEFNVILIFSQNGNQYVLVFCHLEVRMAESAMFIKDVPV
jgi:hypothetical protein